MKQSQYYTLLAYANASLGFQMAGTIQKVLFVGCILSIITAALHTVIEAVVRYKNLK